MSASAPVSIGLPVYNGEAFLSEAVESLLAQDFADFELVIADNASNDGTEEICRAVVRRDPRVSYHRSEVNRGAAWNFSRLLDLTSGRYFRWAAHDDACDPTYLRRCVEVLDEAPEVSLCFARAVRIDETGSALEVERLPVPATQRRAAARARSFLMQPRFPKAAPFGLMRREAAVRTGLIRPYKSSDRVFLMEMAMLGRFHQIDDPLYLHRSHDGRSVRLPSGSRMAWWDGGSEGRTARHWWGLLRGYGAAALASPAAPMTRAEVLLWLGPWMMRHASPLARELAPAHRSTGSAQPRQVHRASS